MTTEKAEDVKADHEIVAKHTLALLNMVSDYCKENEISLLESFMISHNLHKLMVDNIAYIWSSRNKIPEQNTYRAADMTFRQAMKDLRRQLPNQKTL